MRKRGICEREAAGGLECAGRARARRVRVGTACHACLLHAHAISSPCICAGAIVCKAPLLAMDAWAGKCGASSLDWVAALAQVSSLPACMTRAYAATHQTYA